MHLSYSQECPFLYRSTLMCIPKSTPPIRSGLWIHTRIAAISEIGVKHMYTQSRITYIIM